MSAKKVSQKDAVFNAIIVVLNEAKIPFKIGFSSFKDLLTLELKHNIVSFLFEGFKQEKIFLKTYKTDSQLKEYASNILYNWLERDSRLNGTFGLSLRKNPSYKGLTNLQIKLIKALEGLKLNAKNSKDIEEIQNLIDIRLEQFKNQNKK